MSLTVTEFARQVKEQGVIWGLCNPDDAWAMHEDADDDFEMMPVWIDEASANACAVGEWDGFVATALPLADFIRDWLPALEDEGAWLGINFIADEQGDAVDPGELMELLG